MPEPNTGVRNSHGFRADEIRTFVLGSPSLRRIGFISKLYGPHT
jgi:hypothetical protein